MNVAGDTVLLAYDRSGYAKRAIRSCGAVLAPRHAVVVHVWQSLARLLLHTDIRSLTGRMKEAAEKLDAAYRQARRV